MGVLLPAAKYTAQAVDGFLSHTKDGKKKIVVKFAIVGGPHDAQAVDWTGFFTEKTFDRTIKSLRYCGWSGDDISDLTGIDTNEVEIVVGHEEYNGKLYPRVSWVNQIGAGQARMSPHDAKEFAGSIKPRLERMAETESRQEEDVPF